MRYKVVKLIDETGDGQWIDHVGVHTGNKYDGMLELLFHDEEEHTVLENYWPEELEEVGPVGEPDWEV